MSKNETTKFPHWFANLATGLLISFLSYQARDIAKRISSLEVHMARLEQRMDDLKDQQKLAKNEQHTTDVDSKRFENRSGLRY